MKPNTAALAAVVASLLAANDVRKTPASGQASRNHIVRVVSVSQAGLERGSDDLLEATMSRLVQASAFRPDIACLPELFSRRAPEAVPGLVTERLARWASENSSYVIFGLKTSIAGKVFNSAILIDRQGKIAGQFNKIHPTEGELTEGTIPGDVEPPVFQTDFGTIG